MITSAPFMSCREPFDSNRDLAGAVIDSQKFAADRDCLSGKIPLTRLTRLHDALASREGWLDCELEGFRESDASGTKLGLHLRVNGRLMQHCQRCLGEVEFDCAIDNRLVLMPPDAVWPEEELETEDYDAIPASRELSVLSLVEDEVLLALPIVPRHAECAPPEKLAVAEENVASGKPSPFAVLASLKKH